METVVYEKQLMVSFYLRIYLPIFCAPILHPFKIFKARNEYDAKMQNTSTLERSTPNIFLCLNRSVWGKCFFFYCQGASYACFTIWKSKPRVRMIFDLLFLFESILSHRCVSCHNRNVFTNGQREFARKIRGFFLLWYNFQFFVCSFSLMGTYTKWLVTHSISSVYVKD